jgi:1-aminocyclopropane-1-carboxylate deaminase/D-cysteine desulfhydrase-like pyridoxal-dependent ACC family enzyme
MTDGTVIGEPLDFGARGTPLQAAPRLGAALGFAPGALWIKRDDLTGLASGGNKARKLEYVCGDAVASGAQVLVTGGSMPQSNQIGATAAAANRIGMRTRAVLPRSSLRPLEGNLVVNHLMGIDYTWIDNVPKAGMETAIARTAEQLRESGEHPYLIPLGASSPLGALGYVTAAEELKADAPSEFVVYLASGTAGTQAGLAVGLGDHDRVRGIDTGTPWDLTKMVADLAVDTADLAGLPHPGGEANTIDEFVGPGYGFPTEAAREAIYLLAHTEGILSEPTYTGKALAALISDRRNGRLAPDQPTVFLHTGGIPLLYTIASAEWLAEIQRHTA